MSTVSDGHWTPKSKSTLQMLQSKYVRLQTFHEPQHTHRVRTKHIRCDQLTGE